MCDRCNDDCFCGTSADDYPKGLVPDCRVCLACVAYIRRLHFYRRTEASFAWCVTRAWNNQCAFCDGTTIFCVFSATDDLFPCDDLEDMSADTAKKSRLDEAANLSANPPGKRKRLVNRDVLHKVFELFHDTEWYTRVRQANDALAQLFLLNQLGHRYVVRLMESVTSVSVEDHYGTPVCRLVDCEVVVSDAFAAELFRRRLVNPQKLTISRAADDVLPAVACTGLNEFCVSNGAEPIKPEWGRELARIANLNATTLKEIREFPAEYAHLLHGETFTLEEMSLGGVLPEGTTTALPRTEAFDDSMHLVFPKYAHLLNAKKLCYSHGLHEFSPGEVIKSCPHVEEITVHECCLWADTDWVVLLKQLRQAFPNWHHLNIDMDVDVNDVGYDDYFKHAAEEWSDAFEEHLRQDTAPLRIDATMPMYLEDEGHFRAADLPKFKLDVKKDDREGWGTETTFTFTRNEDFGEGRVLCMEAKVERMVRGGAETSTSEEEQDEEESDQED